MSAKDFETEANGELVKLGASDARLRPPSEHERGWSPVSNRK
jgi:hypothetical protein